MPFKSKCFPPPSQINICLHFFCFAHKIWKVENNGFIVVNAINDMNKFLVLISCIQDANDLHLLFEFFSLHDSSSMWIGYLVVWLICTVERWTTYCLDKNCSQHDTARRLVAIAKRTVLYGIATTLRLLYMLVVMYFNTNLFIAVVCIHTIR